MNESNKMEWMATEESDGDCSKNSNKRKASFPIDVIAPQPKKSCIVPNFLTVCLICGDHAREKLDGHTCDGVLKADRMKKAVQTLMESMPSSSTAAGSGPPPPPPPPQMMPKLSNDDHVVPTATPPPPPPPPPSTPKVMPKVMNDDQVVPTASKAKPIAVNPVQDALNDQLKNFFKSSSARKQANNKLPALKGANRQSDEDMEFRAKLKKRRQSTRCYLSDDSDNDNDKEE